MPDDRPFTDDEAALIFRALDGFAEVRSRPGITDLAALISLNVALQVNGLTITRTPAPTPDRRPSSPCGWTAGTPVRRRFTDDHTVWRVAGDRPGESSPSRVTITDDHGGVAQVHPLDLTYEPDAPLIPGERVHHVGGRNRFQDNGTVMSVIPGPVSAIFVRWDDRDQGESGPYPPARLERPIDLADSWEAGQVVHLLDGRPGRVVRTDGARVAVAVYDGTDEDIVWHCVTDLTPRD